MIKCNTCTTFTSSNCIKWEGKPFYFSSTLTNKKDLNENLEKLGEEVKNLKDILNKPLDKKGMVISPSNDIVDYIQWLLDRELEKRNTKVEEKVISVNISDLQSSLCNDSIVNIDKAFSLIISEINALKNKINSNTSNIYIPNV